MSALPERKTPPPPPPPLFKNNDLPRQARDESKHQEIIERKTTAISFFLTDVVAVGRVPSVDVIGKVVLARRDYLQVLWVLLPLRFKTIRLFLCVRPELVWAKTIGGFR